MRRASHRASARSLVASCAIAAMLGACAGAAPTGADDGRAGREAVSADRAVAPPLPGPAVLVPDSAASSTVEVLPDGSRLVVVSGMRVLEHPDGSIERGRDVLPSGSVRVLSLPARLGGGLLVYVVTGGSTQVWRASSWLGDLDPVAELFGVVGEMVAGFDRVYARLLGADSAGDMKAFDAKSGEQVSLGPLPRATRVGPLAFADGWRALVMSDFLGPLATFDAGNTWRAVPLGSRVVHQLGARDGKLLIDTAEGRLALHASGELVADDGPDAALPPLFGAPRGGSSASASTARAVASTDLLGSQRRPLRAAIEDGWPVTSDDGGPAAIFAEAGALYRVALPTGRIEQVRARVFSEEFATCHAVARGRTFGFVCGEAHGATALYAFEAPFDVREVVRFPEPRVLLATSSAGSLVGGRCRGNGEGFCAVDEGGRARDIRVDGLAPMLRRDPRPILLADGRVVIVAPPAPAFAGALAWETTRGWATVPLELGDFAPTMMRSRMVEGLEEREEGGVGGWVLVGQELRGIRIALDGRVTLHASSANVERTAISGRYALDWGRGGRGAETVNGGVTWMPVNVPAFDGSKPARDVTACGPVGCARRGWLRVGWGALEGASDLSPATTPRPSKVSLAPARGLALHCEPTGQIGGPGAPPPAVAQEGSTSGTGKPRPARPSIVAHAASSVGAAAVAASSAAVGGASPWPWSSFRGVTPPALGHGETGVQAGTDPPFSTQARLYAWGARGGDWLRGGHWLGRFEDRFAMRGAHSTTSSPSLWPDGDRAAEALGVSAGQAVSWSALLDPAGDAVVLVAQRGAGKVDLYGAAEGEPPLQFRSAGDGPLPVPSSVVRVGASWYLLATAATNNVWSSTVYRVDGAVVRPLIRLPRVPIPLGEMPPRLMRRTDSAAIGLLVLGAAGFGQVVRDWYVLPIDEERRALAEPVRLIGSDLEGRAPSRCSADQEGWLVNTDLSLAPAIRVVGHESASLSGVELRLRLERGTACAEALAARFDGWLSFVRPARSTTPEPLGDRLPLVATHPESGRRWMLRCQ